MIANKLHTVLNINYYLVLFISYLLPSILNHFECDLFSFFYKREMGLISFHWFIFFLLHFLLASLNNIYFPECFVNRCSHADFPKVLPAPEMTFTICMKYYDTIHCNIRNIYIYIYLMNIYFIIVKVPV